MDSAFRCQMTRAKILSAAKVVLIFIPAKAWRQTERWGLKFVNSLRSETVVNRDTKISVFLLRILFTLSSICLQLLHVG